MKRDDPPRPFTSFDAMAATPPLAEARFTCTRHGTEAGVVRVHGNDAEGWLAVVDGPAGRHLQRVSRPAAATRLRDALARVDARDLYRLDLEWAPFFCPVCERVYCPQCWHVVNEFDPDMPGWLDEVRGTCPVGHERMLSD